MTLKADLYFRLDGRRWSERYYLQPVNPDLQKTLRLLVDTRIKLSAAPCVLDRGKICDIDEPRKGLNVRFKLSAAYGFHGGPPTFLNVNVPATIAEYSVGIGWAAGNGPKRILWISGIPAQQEIGKNSQKRSRLGISYIPVLKTFREALMAGDLNLQIRHLIQEAEPDAKVIKSIGTNADGLYLIETFANHARELGDRVRVLGSRGNNMSRARGLRIVVDVPSPKQVVINRGPLPEKGVLSYTGGAALHGVGYTYSKAFWTPVDDDAFTKDVLFNTVTQTFPFEYFVTSKLRGAGSSPRKGRERRR